MSKFLAIFCAIFLFHNSCAIPVEHEEKVDVRVTNLFKPLIDAVALAPAGSDLQATAVKAVKDFVDTSVSTAIQTTKSAISDALNAVTNIVPSFMTSLNALTTNLEAQVNAAISAANSLNLLTSPEAQAQIQEAYGAVNDFVSQVEQHLTMAIENAASTIVSRSQGSISDIPMLATDLTSQVLTALVSLKIVSGKAIRILNDLLPAVNTGLSGVLNCSTKAIADSQSASAVILSTFETTATSFTQDIATCLSETSDDAILACVTVSVCSSLYNRFVV